MSNKNLYKILQWIIYAVIAFLLYANTIEVFFLADDFRILYAVRHFDLLSLLFDPPEQFQFFRPFRFLSWKVFHSIFDLNPAGYHIVNILLHTTNAWLVSLCLKGLIDYSNYKQGKWLGLWGGLLFLCFPYQTEVVSWLSGITPSLATTFTLLAWYFYMRFAVKNRQQAATKTQTIYFLLSLACFFFALFNKEVALFFPGFVMLFILLIRQTQHKPLSRGQWYGAGLYILTLPIYFGLRYLVLGGMIKGYGAAIHLNFDPILIGYHYLLYGLKFLFYYRFLPPPVQDVLLQLKGNIPLLIGVMTILIITLGWVSWKIKGKFRKMSDQNLLIFFLLVGLLISLTPVINLDTSFIYDTRSDRYSYLPSAFYCMFVVLILAKFIKKQWFLGILLFGVCLLMATTVYQTNQNWKRAGTLTKNILEEVKTAPGNQNIYIINMPAYYKGAYIFPVCFEEAVQLFTDHSKKVQVVSHFPLYNRSDKVVFNKSGDTVKLHLANSKSRFLWVQPPEHDSYKIVAQKNRTLKLIVKARQSNYYYWQDSLRAIR